MSIEKQNEALALECLRRLDEQGDLFELLDDEVQVMYPKWGVARGKAEIGQMFADFGMYLGSMRHDYDSFRYLSRGDRVCIEGVSRGTLADGKSWEPNGGETARFCTVFEFHAGKVKRLFVYLDPDYCDQSNAIYGWKNSTITNEVSMQNDSTI